MSFVYLIGPADWRHAAVKIGVTSGHPLNRLACFQTGSPVKLDLYGYFEGNHELERTLHETFRPVHRHGEWFNLDGRLLAFVGDLYFSTLGRRKWSNEELYASINSLVLSDTPPHPSFSTESEWLDSANGASLSAWMADGAYAAPDAETLQ